MPDKDAAGRLNEVDRGRLTETGTPGRYRAASGRADHPFVLIETIDDHALVVRFDAEYRLVAGDGDVERLTLTTERVEDRPIGAGWCQEHASVHLATVTYSTHTIERHYVVLLTDRVHAESLTGPHDDTIVVRAPDAVTGRIVDRKFLGAGTRDILRSVGAVADMMRHGGAAELLGGDTENEAGSGWWPVGWTLGDGTPMEDAAEHRWVPVGPLHPCPGEAELAGIGRSASGAADAAPDGAADGSLCAEIETGLELLTARYEHLLQADNADGIEELAQVRRNIDELRWRLATCRALSAAPNIGASITVIEGLDIGVDDPASSSEWSKQQRSALDDPQPDRCVRFALLASYLTAQRDDAVVRRDAIDAQLDALPTGDDGRQALWDQYAVAQRRIDLLDMRITWAEYLHSRCRRQQLDVAPLVLPDVRLSLPTPEEIELIKQTIGGTVGAGPRRAAKKQAPSKKRAAVERSAAALGGPRSTMPDGSPPKAPGPQGDGPVGRGCLTDWRFVTPAVLLVITLLVIAGWVASGDGSSPQDAAPVASTDPEPADEPTEAQPVPESSDDAADASPTASPPAPVASTGPPSTSPPRDAAAELADNLFDSAASVWDVLDAVADAQRYFSIYVDPPGGSSFESSGETGVVRLEASVARSSVGVVSIAAEYAQEFANQSSHPCGAVTSAYRVTCPPGAALLAAGDYIIVAVELEGPIDADATTTRAYGLFFDDDGDDSDNFDFVPPFDESFIRNTEHWYQLQVDPDGTRSMWVDGMSDGVPGVPRFSSALVIESGSTLLWVIPRSEIPGELLAYRASAFATSGDAAQPPVPSEAGGDATGASVTEPLIAIDTSGPKLELDDPSGLPPDVDGTTKRAEVPADPDAQITAVLIADAEARINAALAGGDVEQVVSLVHPQFLGGPTGDACRAEMEGSLALADSVSFAATPATLDVSTGFPLYITAATINFPNGAVDWGPAFLPGPQGRLYLILPACLQE